MRTIKEIQADIDSERAKARRLNNLQNEGRDGYNHAQNDSRLTELADEMQAAMYPTDWTKNETIARRAEWNAAIRGGCKTAAEGTAKTGIKLGELKNAVRRWSL